MPILSEAAQTALTVLQDSRAWIVKVDTQHGQSVHLALYDAHGQLAMLALATFNELVNAGLIQQTRADVTPNGAITLSIYRVRAVGAENDSPVSG